MNFLCIDNLFREVTLNPLSLSRINFKFIIRNRTCVAYDMSQMIWIRHRPCDIVINSIRHRLYLGRAVPKALLGQKQLNIKQIICDNIILTTRWRLFQRFSKKNGHRILAHRPPRVLYCSS